MSEEIDARVAGWLARVAEALESVQSFDSGYGAFYVSRIDIAFDGEATNLRLVPSDAGAGFDLHIGRQDA